VPIMAVAAIHHAGAHWIVPIGIVGLAVVVSLAMYPLSKRHNLDFDLPVGVNEQHTVHYFRNAFTGRVRIAVDGQPEQKHLELLSFSLQKRYELSVGHLEKHSLVFAKTRKLILAGIRNQTVTVYIDGKEDRTVNTHGSLSKKKRWLANSHRLRSEHLSRQL
jgi:hypothetical protein